LLNLQAQSFKITLQFELKYTQHKYVKHFGTMFREVRNRVCQMLYFRTKNPILYKYYGVPLNGKCFHICWPFGIFDSHLVHITYGHLVHFVVVLHIFYRFVII
jgi:hypothetical protein